VAVRQAAAWALDRSAIVKTVYGGEATVGNDFATFPDYAVQPKGITPRSQNLAEVKKLLGSQVISFTITTYTDEQTYAQLIQQELDATGNFKVSLDVLTEAAYYANGSTSPWLAAPVTLTDWADRLPAQLYSLIYVASSGPRGRWKKRQRPSTCTTAPRTRSRSRSAPSRTPPSSSSTSATARPSPGSGERRSRRWPRR
jgi:ABC-type transport system substrate-binding protein